jgi:lipopolysaccharide/colanic/teichoic acid biosynthesis glycosyltransferase
MAQRMAAPVGVGTASLPVGRILRSAIALPVIAGAVAIVAISLEDATRLRAIVIGVAAALLTGVAESYAPSGAWRTRRTLSVFTIAAAVIALSVGWDAARIGLEPLHALLALGISAVAIAAIRALQPEAATERVLIVGSGYAADALGLALAREARNVVVGRIDDSNEPGLLGDLGAFETVVGAHGVTTVAFAYSHAPDAQLALIASRCRELDLAVGIVPRLFEEFDQRLRVEHGAGVPLLVVDPWPHQARMPLMSRVADVVVATVLLVLSLPLWIVISLAIFIEEPGPILYRARRIGQHGEAFSMFKFRKMRRDAAGPSLTVAGDERFTRIGRLLALTKLDELPQLLNVMRGEMSLVGPRPEDPVFVDDFRDEFTEILRVRPGITGLSQIQYRNESALLVGDEFDALYRNELLPRKLDLDRYYARRRSLALDARILMWTAIAVVAGARIRRNELTSSVSFERHDAQEISLT